MISPHTIQNDHPHPVSGNISWYSNYQEQYGGSL